MRSPLFILSLITLILTACNVPKDLQPDVENLPQEQINAIEVRQKMQAEKAAEMEQKDEVPMQKNTYTTYTNGVIGNGQISVLFFHATWCPACKKNNELLEEWYSSEQFSRSVYKIDFDTATELRKQFGVTGQDTFILIDESGEEIERISFPSQSALRALLG
ncbi:hypothetical protein COU75_02155 [Candidatus Peregrinibacteria bacterium CG10_big_fil_rev_8_21_14_0_10_42_8]|nr:MAG: hypothetical protein COU75_02155 [Candidatus Peregrinibacteria bacterium CG10_big_fil_rev_8_21_14_0_10_42_8]